MRKERREEKDGGGLGEGKEKREGGRERGGEKGEGIEGDVICM